MSDHGHECRCEELAERVAQLEELRAGRSVYTPKTLAAELEITSRAVRAAIKRGELEARKSGFGWVIGAEAVAEWARPPTRKRRSARPVKRRPLRDAMTKLGDS